MTPEAKLQFQEFSRLIKGYNQQISDLLEDKLTPERRFQVRAAQMSVQILLDNQMSLLEEAIFKLEEKVKRSLKIRKWFKFFYIF